MKQPKIPAEKRAAERDKKTVETQIDAKIPAPKNIATNDESANFVATENTEIANSSGAEDGREISDFGVSETENVSRKSRKKPRGATSETPNHDDEILNVDETKNIEEQEKSDTKSLVSEAKVDNLELTSADETEIVGDENAAKDEETVWPDELFTAILRAVAPRDLWAWLREDSQAALCREIARGFQQSPRALSQTLVRSRLKTHFQREKATRETFEKWWKENAGAPVLEAVSTIENEDSWRAQISELAQKFGFEVLQLGAFFDARFPLPDADLATQSANRVLETPQNSASSVHESQTRIAEKSSSESSVSNAGIPKINAQTSDTNSTALSQEILAERQRAQRAEQNFAQLRRENDATKREFQSLQREREQQKHLTVKREIDAQKKLDESQKNFEREARRARGYEKELEELQAETRRLRRLVRQGQLLQEETRRQVAHLQREIDAKNAPVAPISSTQSPIATPNSVAANAAKAPNRPLSRKPTTPPIGRDAIFVWSSEGREIRVTPREIKERIDRNDEFWVGELARDIELLRENDGALAKRFLSSVRELGRYYARVFTAGTTRVLVDASNVARYEKDFRGRGQFQLLVSMRDELRRYDCFPILFYADASLPHNIDEPAELAQMVRRGELEIVTIGTEADDILAREARRSGASVVTNDRNFHRRVAPDWEPTRIAFFIRDGIIALEGME